MALITINQKAKPGIGRKITELDGHEIWEYFHQPSGQRMLRIEAGGEPILSLKPKHCLTLAKVLQTAFTLTQPIE